MTHTPTSYPPGRQAEEERTPLRDLALALLRRWPTYLGIALAVLLVTDGTPTAAMVLAIAGLAYLATAVIDRPGSVWLVLIVLLVVARSADFLDLSYWVFLGPIAVVTAVVGLVGGRLLRPGVYRMQLPQMAAVAAVVVLAEFAGPTYAGYLVAVALLGHAIWDVAHWRANRVVTRSLAECCAVLDTLLGLGLIVILAF